MRNYIGIGPVRLKLSARGIADWGYPSIHIGGLSLFTRDSGGGLTIASYHPRSSGTWYWSLSIQKGGLPNRQWVRRSTLRNGQWHDYYRLPFGRDFLLSRQDYHKK